MNNGKAFPSLDGTATCDMTSCSFYQALASQKVLDFLRPAKTQFIRKESSNKRKNVNLKLKTKRTEVKCVGLVKLLAINSNLFHWTGQIMNNHHKIIS